jgi:hypothetical protein
MGRLAGRQDQLADRQAGWEELQTERGRGGLLETGNERFQRVVNIDSLRMCR